MTSFSKAWASVPQTSQKRKSRKAMKLRVTRSNRRAAKVNPECGLVKRLTDSFVGW